jgi:hypothetical protein
MYERSQFVFCREMFYIICPRLYWEVLFYIQPGTKEQCGFYTVNESGGFSVISYPKLSPQKFVPRNPSGSIVFQLLNNEPWPVESGKSRVGGRLRNGNLTLASGPKPICGIHESISHKDEKTIKKGDQDGGDIGGMINHPFLKRLFWLGVVSFLSALIIAFWIDPLRLPDRPKDKHGVQKRSEDNRSE